MRRFRLTWLLLALLAAFVIFIECIAEAGGKAPPVYRSPHGQGWHQQAPGSYLSDAAYSPGLSVPLAGGLLVP